MIAIKLREAMERRMQSTGKKVTYLTLARETGLAHGTIQIMGSQPYNATLETIEKLCHALSVTPGELLELIDDPPNFPRLSKAKKPIATRTKRTRKGG
jgi:DNA-binding Xre family transcriptional regulator